MVIFHSYLSLPDGKTNPYVWIQPVEKPALTHSEYASEATPSGALAWNKM